MAFERRNITDPAAERQVRRALTEREGRASLADLVVATGLPELTVEQAVSRLIDAYDGAILVAKGGALHYRFVMGRFGIKRRREKRVLWRAAVRTSATLTAAAVRAFELSFRAVLAVQMLVYLIVILTPISVVAGVVVGVVLLVGVLFSGEDVSGLLELLTDPYGAAFVFFCSSVYGTYLVFQKKIAWLTAVVGKDERGKKGIAGFISQINDFALGPDKAPTRAERIDRAWPVSQDDERRILERIRQQGGRLRAGHLVAWLGFDFAEAERQAGRLAVEYGGVPESSEIDVLEFSFAPLLVTEGGSVGSDRRTTHEEGVRLPRLTANTLQENSVIALFALVNLSIAAVANHVLTLQANVDLAHAKWWHAAAIAGGKIPFAFSLLLFAVFVVRIPAYALRLWLGKRRKQRSDIHGVLVRHAQEKGEDTLDLRSVAAPTEQVRALAIALEGTFDLDSADDPTKTVWRFRRLAHELKF